MFPSLPIKSLLITLAFAGTALAEDTYDYPPASPQRADVAGIRIEWQVNHQRIVDAIRKQQPDIVFLGDSITAGWGDQFKEKFGTLNAYNAGISGDRTQNILWRIENGVLETKPRVVVLLIGTNNILFGYTPEQTFDGQKAILKKIKEVSPETKIILMGLLPQGELATHPNRPKMIAINDMLAKEGDDKTVFFINAFDQFLQPDGTLTREIAPDFLHLGKKGYEIWHEAIKEALGSALILSLSGSLAVAGNPGEPESATNEAQPQPLRVLHIGNSFSANATHFLPQLAEAGGKKLEIMGCTLAGCTFQTHASHLKKAKEGTDGNPYRVAKTFSPKEQISLPEALALRQWDVVTIQQASPASWRPESYEPHASEIIAEVRSALPAAKLHIHQTWAYRHDHPLFAGTSQMIPERMFELLSGAYEQLGQRHGITDFLPSGLAIQMASKTDEWKHQQDPHFDYSQLEEKRLPREKCLFVGPTSITRQKDKTLKLNSDSAHLGPAGCYLAACVWYEVLFNDSVLAVDFTPSQLTPEEAASLRKIAHEAVAAYRKHGLAGTPTPQEETTIR